MTTIVNIMPNAVLPTPSTQSRRRALPPTIGPSNRRVVILAYDGLCLFEFGIATEFFALPRPELDVPWYDCRTASTDGQRLHAAAGVSVAVDAGLEALRDVGTIVLPGWKGVTVPVPPSLCAALVEAHARGARILSICSGVFVLAAAGLLDGRRATTHWRYTETLATAYPQVQVVPDVLYVDEGDVLTSAGSAAGIDMCLHLVRRDYSADVANTVARRLVVPPHRDGGQAQFVERPVPVVREAQAFGELFDWLQANLQQTLTVSQLAQRVMMSERTFVRRFREASGVAPGEWLARARVQRACEILESSDQSIDRVAVDCGFGTAATLRHHFRKRLGVRPTVYRERFRSHSIQ